MLNFGILQIRIIKEKEILLEGHDNVKKRKGFYQNLRLLVTVFLSLMFPVLSFLH